MHGAKPYRGNPDRQLRPGNRDRTSTGNRCRVLALVDRQAELRQPLCQRCEELSPIRSVLTADHQVIRIPTHDDLPGCSMSPPLVYPEVDDIMEEDVRKNWADPRSLRHPHLPRFPSAA